MAKKTKKTEKAGIASPVFKAFQAHKGLIAHVLRRYSMSQVDIADISQETLLRALEAEKRQDIQEPKRFLVGVAKNVARSELERRSNNTRRLIDDFDLETYVSNEPLADEIFDSRRRLGVFAESVAALPPQCRKVMVLKHVYGASHRDIADKLDIAVSTVEKHVALGLKRCREAMRRVSDRPSDEVPETVVQLSKAPKRGES